MQANFYGEHRDTGSAVTNRRVYSVVCPVNSSFEGGATIFPTINLSVRLKIGEAILFPSHYLHRGDVITRGEKFVVVFFLDEQTTPPAVTKETTENG